MENESEQLYSGVTVGEPIYDENGNRLGTVRGVDTAGFYVLADRGERTTAPMTRIRDITGTAYVMWRCWECGEMGRIEGNLPDHCPSCQTPRENLYYWAED